MDRTAGSFALCSRRSPGESPNLEASAQGLTSYATAWDGFVNIPADGGYTFHLIDRDGARLVIDGMEVAKTGRPFAPGLRLAGQRAALRPRFHRPARRPARPSR